MPNIDRNIIEQIKDRIDILQYISTFVTLKRAGKDYKGRCPFHVEKTPSFTVSLDKGFYHCFGCNKGGDIIDFVKEYDAVSFSEAVEILADYSGVDLAKTEEESEEYTALKLNRKAMEIYHQHDRISVASFFKKRKLSEELIDVFHVGFATDNVLSKRLKDNTELLAKIGLLSHQKEEKYRDRFDKRLIFPIIHNKYPIGFGGRKTEDWQEAKYVNSRSSIIYDKSRALFGLAQSKKAMRDVGFTYLVEGYTDVLSLWSMGIENAVAGCGTAFTFKQSKMLAGVCHSIRIMFDGDDAGRKAAYRAAVIALKNGMIPYITELPKGQDPNNILIKKGSEKAKEYIDKHTQIFYEHYGKMVSMHPEHRRIQLVKNLQYAVNDILDDVTRQILQQSLANYFDVSPANLRKRGKKALAMSIDQQMLACLLNENVGSHIFRMVKAEDFLEEVEVFKYILDGYELDEPQDVKRLLEKYKDKHWYLDRAIVPPFQATKTRAKVLARKLRLRTINSLITKITDQIEKRISEEKEFADLQSQWDQLRDEQLILGNFTDNPQW